jgi:hypothetical protein
MDTAIRPKAALVFLGAAISVGVVLVGSTVGWYFLVANSSGTATGEVVNLSFVGCPEAAPVIAARLADYGMPAEQHGMDFRVTLPGRMPDERTHIPAALAAPGVLAVSIDGTPKAVTVKSVGVQLAFSGTPITLLMMSEALPEQGVSATIDGKKVDIEEVTGEELQLAGRAGQSDEAIRIATDRAVSVRYPLPCPVTVNGP